MRTCRLPVLLRMLVVSVLLTLQGTALAAPGGDAILAQVGGATYAVAVSDDCVYVGVGPNLVVLAPARPPWTVVGSIRLPDLVRGLAVDGEQLYVAAGQAGLLILSLEDTTKLEVASTLPLSGPALGVTVAAGVAYVAAGQAGVAAVDVHDPSQPGAPFWVPIEGESVAITVSPPYAYVAAGWGALRILSLADPLQPQVVGSYLQIYEAFGVAVAGEHAFVAAGSDGLKILSLANPVQPRLETSEPLGQGVARSVAITLTDEGSAAYAYIAAQEGGLWVVNVGNPQEPVSSGPFETPTWNARFVTVSSGQALVADSAGGLVAFDLTDPGAPYATDTYSGLGDARGLASANGIILVAGGATGVHSLYWAEGQPILRDTLDSDGEAMHVVARPPYAYVANGQLGLQVVSIADPAALTQVVQLTGPGIAHSVVVAGDVAYLACDDAGLWIVSLADPAAPVSIAVVDTPGQAMDVAIVGRYAFIADGDAGLQVVDVGDPEQADLVGEGADTFGFAAGVALDGQYAYIADSAGGLAVVDVHNVEFPGVVGSLSTTGQALDVMLRGGYAYLATGAEGVQWCSVTLPELPSSIRTVRVPGSAVSVWAEDWSLPVLVAARDGGLAVVEMVQRTYLPVLLR